MEPKSIYKKKMHFRNFPCDRYTNLASKDADNIYINLIDIFMNE